MKVADGPLHGVLVFEPAPIRDERGFFTRTFDADVATNAGLDVSRFVQDSQSRSQRGVVRGLHFRTDGGEGKLVRCSYGQIYDVAVDLRPWSPTFRHTQAFRLDDEDHVSVYLPRGLAHGFQALTDIADVCYRIDARYRPGVDGVISWDDPELAIAWPAPMTGMSDRDAAASRLSDVSDRLDEWFGTPAASVSMSTQGPAR